MKKLEYRVTFTTPAFLGNAEQAAQWRTPPFKALLRQWWRVACAKCFDYDRSRMRTEEGQLFGHAWLTRPVNGHGETWASQSRVRVRLQPWLPGTLQNQQWPGGTLGEVRTTRDGRGRVRADLYLGFGPVSLQRTLSHPPAIAPGTESSQLRVFGEFGDEVVSALQLIHWFGALGSRSRNGWGSIRLDGDGVLKPLPDQNHQLLAGSTREWTKCLDCDWPHAIGTSDNCPLVWVMKTRQDSWRAVMSTLAHLKVGVRAEAKKHRDSSGIGGVHLLGYPAGRDWVLSALDGDARVAAQLRAKVINTGDGLVGMLFHLPCRFPDVLRSRLQAGQRAWLDENERRVWSELHRFLDASDKLVRLGGNP